MSTKNARIKGLSILIILSSAIGVINFGSLSTAAHAAGPKPHIRDSFQVPTALGSEITIEGSNMNAAGWDYIRLINSKYMTGIGELSCITGYIYIGDSIIESSTASVRFRLPTESVFKDSLDEESFNDSGETSTACSESYAPNQTWALTFATNHAFYNQTDTWITLVDPAATRASESDLTTGLLTTNYEITYPKHVDCAYSGQCEDKLFDGTEKDPYGEGPDALTKFFNPGSDSMTVEFDFSTTYAPYGIILTGLGMTTGDDSPDRDPISWVLQGSNVSGLKSDSDWTEIYRSVGLTTSLIPIDITGYFDWSPSELIFTAQSRNTDYGKRVLPTSTTAYRYFKFVVLDNFYNFLVNAGYYDPIMKENPGTQLSSLKLFGFLPSEVPLIAPPEFSYTQTSINAVVGTAVTALVPNNTGGTITNWSITPTLPAGLSINNATGEISGTPTVTSASTSYTVTANGPGGSPTKIITISIAAAPTPPPVIPVPTPKPVVVIGPPPSTLKTITKPTISRESNSFKCTAGTFIFIRNGSSEEAPKLTSQIFSLMQNGVIVASNSTLETTTIFPLSSASINSTVSCQVQAGQENLISTVSSLNSELMNTLSQEKTHQFKEIDLKYYSDRQTAYAMKALEFARILSIKKVEISQAKNAEAIITASNKYRKSFTAASLKWKEELLKASRDRLESKEAAQLKYLNALENAGVSVYTQ